MRLLILTALCLGTGYVMGQECVAGDQPQGCYDVPNIARINCPEGVNCVCEADCNSVISADDLNGIFSEQMSGAKCREICETSKEDPATTSKCEYFRWEEASVTTAEHCSLMSDSQCTEFDPCIGSQCKSGQAGCGSGDNPSPPGLNCNAGSTLEDGKIHWKCINPYDELQARIDLYVDGTIEPGVICTTSKCATFDNGDDSEDPNWLYRTLAVFCDGTSGKWVNFPSSTNDPAGYISDGEKLVDPDCEARVPGSLVLDKAALTETGASFICSDVQPTYTDDDVTVTAPNTCALLCNFHHVMTIEPEFVEEEGKSHWWLYKTGGGEEGEEAIRSKVYCWNQPTTDAPPEPTSAGLT